MLHVHVLFKEYLLSENRNEKTLLLNWGPTRWMMDIEGECSVLVFNKSLHRIWWSPAFCNAEHAAVCVEETLQGYNVIIVDCRVLFLCV